VTGLYCRGKTTTVAAVKRRVLTSKNSFVNFTNWSSGGLQASTLRPIDQFVKRIRDFFMASKLEKYLANELYTRLGHLSTRQNYRPDWMEGLELDFYIEELNLAAEVQGDQHYRFVPHFHGSRDRFEEQQDRDAKKSLICRQKGIRLVEIYTETDADIFVKSIQDKQKPPKYFYQDPSRKEKRKTRHQEIEMLKEHGLWVSKSERRNNPKNKFEVAKRLNKCKQNIKDYESGKIQAPEHKYLYWKQVVEDDGISRPD